MIDVDELRQNLLHKYNRNEIAKILGVSETHVSRLLNKKNKMSVEQYNILIKELKI